MREALTSLSDACVRAKRGADFIAHLEQLDRLYGSKPGRETIPVMLVEDNGPIHASKIALAALAARKRWPTAEWLPKHAPELNDIEVVWYDLKAPVWSIRHPPMPKLSIAKSGRLSKPRTARKMRIRWSTGESLPSPICGHMLLWGNIIPQFVELRTIH